jgi:hypothetical protein
MIRNLDLSKRISLQLAVSVSVLLCLGITTRLKAQTVGATLSGTITDASGAVVPKANITITNTATGVVRTASTNQVGVYSAPNLQPDDYTVAASAPGFASQSTTLTLTIGAQQTLNLTLSVGASTQTVEITGAAPNINLVESTLGGLNNESQILELPLNGRSWSDLATLQAGVYQMRAVVAVSNHDRWARGYGEQLSISGARPQQNNYRLNGVSINDPTNGGPGSVLGGNMGVDAISEFSVLTTNYSTEYGRASGGIINAITKSGTNNFHGSVYEFLRNSSLDARNFFDLGGVPPFRRNQFGASAGGPIRKGKTFIFGDYEGLRQFLSISQVDTVPSANARNGILSGGALPVTSCPVGSSIPAPGVSNTCVDHQATRYLNAFFPLPNGQVFGDTGLFSFPDSQSTSENYFTVRVDHKLSDKDSLSGTYFQDGSSVRDPDEFGLKFTTTVVNRHFVTLEETHIFASSTVNDFRVGFNRVADGAPASSTAIKPVASDPSYGFLPGESSGAIAINGLTAFSGGQSALNPESHHWNAYQVYDDVLVTKGIHSIKFGASFERDQDNLVSTGRVGGIFQFGSLASFLTNQPQTLQISIAGVGTTAASIDLGAKGYQRESIIGTYIQDDAHLRPNLTLNLGLRWEMNTVPTEVYGRLSNLLSVFDAFPHLGDPLYHNNSTRDFEPRVGFAWDPFSTGKTSVRGGFGIYDNLFFLAYFDHASTTFPFTQGTNLVNLPQGSFPTPVSVASASVNLDAKNATHWDPNPGRSYVMQWNTSIQREIMPNLSVLIGYVGSHGIHGVTVHDDVGMTLPISSPVGYLWPCVAPGLPFVPAGTTPPPGLKPGCNGISSAPRSNTHVGRLRSENFRNSSVYHGLQLQLTKRMSHGLQLGGSFNWSKSIDIASGAINGDTYLTGISSGYDFIDPKLTRGVSDFNTPRTVTINYLWDLPMSKSVRGVATELLGGWEVGGIFSASDGSPFTPFIAGDPVGSNSNDPLGWPDRLTGPGCDSLVNPGSVGNYIKLQCFALPSAPVVGGIHYLRKGNAGRNILPGPGLENFDFSVIKNTHVKRLSESFVVQFRAEFFNLFNRANFLPPTDNQTIMDPSIPGFGITPADPTTAIISGAGALTKTSTTSRQIQGALKLIW